ncbi:CLUMA_CG004454, isoform A [Clunio marinus]|uniref:CLUMA_CG004454, isoform A n=1 Tax=Clunio marinus TaxID=568069 RepID=A0A1J1HT76_9DIPT|nr:CLUMA_CG004454, isoform A [Clunio marinus]
MKEVCVGCEWNAASQYKIYDQNVNQNQLKRLKTSIEGKNCQRKHQQSLEQTFACSINNSIERSLPYLNNLRYLKQKNVQKEKLHLKFTLEKVLQAVFTLWSSLFREKKEREKVLFLTLKPT